MAEFIARAHLKLLVESRGSRADCAAKLTVPSGLGKIQVDFDLSNGSIISCMSAIEISAECYSMLEASSKLGGASVRDQSEIQSALKVLHSTTAIVISMLKYHLNYTWIQEHLYAVTREEWKSGESEWKVLPQKISATMEVFQEVPLNAVAIECLQTQLESGITPLIGLRHLHRAKNESMPHHKWIDATTAAELCIKEILIRARPELQELLLQLPAPPLQKLYGPILKHYLGQQSPYLPAIKMGVEKRNSLVHRPSSTSIDMQEAITYVGKVDAAIWHALSLLYPTDKLVKNLQRER
jgi:hypothetical protein